MPWQCRVAVPWQCRGSAVAVAVPWQCRVAVPWLGLESCVDCYSQIKKTIAIIINGFLNGLLQEQKIQVVGTKFSSKNWWEPIYEYFELSWFYPFIVSYIPR